MRRSILIISLACCLSLLSLACLSAPAVSRQPVVGTRVGQLAPDFTLVSAHGTEITLSQYRGQPVLLNFFATWCGPCRAEMPDMQRVYQQYWEQGLAIVAVDIEESSDQVTGFGQDLQLSFPLLLDRDGKIGDSYGARSIPRTFFIDHTGVIRRIYIGSMEEADIAGAVDELIELAQAAPTITPVPAEASPQTADGSIQGCVNIKSALARSGPGRQYPGVSVLAYQTCLPVDARTPDGAWLRLVGRSAEDGSQLWIAAEYMDVKGDPGILPVIQ